MKQLIYIAVAAIQLINVAPAFTAPGNYGLRVTGQFSDGLAPAAQTNSTPVKWGYVNTNGYVVIPATFAFAMPFSEGMASVCLGEQMRWGESNQWAYIDTNGNTVHTFWRRYDADDPYQPNPFCEGLALVRAIEGTNVLWYFINKSGDIVIPPNPIWFPIMSFSEGLAMIRTRSELHSGYINQKGQVVIEPKFEMGDAFSEGFAAVELSRAQDRRNFGYINTSGDIVIGPHPWLPGLGRFSEGLAAVEVRQGQGSMAITGKCGYINTHGEFVIQPQFDSAYGLDMSFHSGKAQARKDGVIVEIDTKGNILRTVPKP